MVRMILFPVLILVQLLWKKLESNYAKGQHDLAESWCQLSLHKAFQNCGAGNTSKLER